MAAQATATAGARPYQFNLMQVILASSAGTVIEWYDFYIYGALAVFFSTYFFPKGNPTVALLQSAGRVLDRVARGGRDP